MTRQQRRAAERAARKRSHEPMTAVSVLASAPEVIAMAPRLFGPAFLSSRVVAGRGYVLVRGDLGRTAPFMDIDDTVLLETTTLPTLAAAEEWIAADVEQRRRPS